MTRAVAAWNAAELEEAIIAAKGAGGHGAEPGRNGHAILRPPPSPGLPLMEIVRIGDSAPEPLPRRKPSAVRYSRRRPDAGASRSDLRPHAGRARRRCDEDHRRPICPTSGIRNSIPAMASFRAFSICGSRGMSRRCVGWCGRRTCFRQGYRPGTLDARGLSPEELGGTAAGAGLCLAVAFGHTGPWASRRGFDTVVQSGQRHHHAAGRNRAGRLAGPQFYPVSAIDYCTGYLMAFGSDGRAGAPR